MNDELEKYIMEYESGTTWTTMKPRVKPKVDPIESATDERLVFELIKRGYAVAKMSPEDLAKNV